MEPAVNPSPDRLLNRNFLLLLQGVFVSQVGSQAFLIVVLLWFKQATGSAALVALSAIAATAPRILFGPLGGTLADRYSRRNVLVACEAVGGLAVLACGFAFLSGTASTGLMAGALIALAVLLGSTAAVFSPAMTAAVPDLVPARQVASANSLIQGAVQIAGLVATVAGGLLFRVVGVAVFALVNGVGHLLAATSERFIQLPPAAAGAAAPRRGAAPWMAQTVEGFRYVSRHTGLRDLLLAVALLSFFTSPLAVVLPFYVERRLGTGPEWFGFLLAAWSTGALGGYVLASRAAGTGRSRAARLLVSAMALAALMAVLAELSNAPLALAVLALAGALDGFLYVEMLTLVQTVASPSIRGRVLALLRTVQEGVAPIGMALAGGAADLLGRDVAPILVACGVSLALASLVMAVRSDLYPLVARGEMPPDLTQLEAKPRA